MTKCFDTAFVVLDEEAKPIIIIPEDLPEGEAFLKIVNGGIDIGVGELVRGQIRGMDDAQLAMLGLQDSIGMATFKGQVGEEMPNEIAYVATVTDTRF
ncbi:MAG TPA: hypothetical protein VIN59_08755 [Alphaproteobacteria bacterium]